MKPMISAAQRFKLSSEREARPPQLSVAVVPLVQLGFGLMGFLNMLAAHPTGVEMAGSLITFSAVLGLQLVHCLPTTAGFRARNGLWTLSLQAVLSFLPVIVFGVSWGGMAGFLAGSILLIVESPLMAWTLFGLTALTMAATAAVQGRGPVEIVYLGLATVLTGLFTYSVTRLTELLGEAYRKRQELAELAVTQERLRFARDLHDLLGYGLSSITLKSELTYRLVGLHDDRARKELREVLEIARQALSDVRSVASGYRDLSLPEELASVERVLYVAEVKPSVTAGAGRLHHHTETVLATVLREGVTNLLRHSKARECRISLTEEAGHVELKLSNDGVEPKSGLAAMSGTGLGNLDLRLRQIGGSLSTRVDAGGWFHLVARCPVTPGQPLAKSSQFPHRSEWRPVGCAH